GKHKAGNYAEAIIISQEFHKALVGIPKPTFFEKRNNVWSVADRIAWGEQPFPDFSLTKDYFQNLSTLLTTNKLPDQIIHGDWGHGNILFDKDDKPVIIDFSPYWRPADFSIAIMIVDALAYEGADVSIVELCTNINDFNQLLLRALTRRICEYIGHQNHPENTQDRSKDIEIHLNTFNTIFQK
ncbi:phosphotransferase, partial [Patescibacteria group bacterium]|nr:phosphotransferase [Patescibacteria group bacterium]